MRILLIDDDPLITQVCQRFLERSGCQVDVADDGDTGLELALRGTYDVAIVDWMLPGRDGPAFCRALRLAHQALPVLMLTARDEVADRVAGLTSGADDYLGKPFALEELWARLLALSRRHTGRGDAQELRAGDLVMDLSLHTARRGQHPLELTPTEWRLLECLLRHQGQAMTREQLLDYAWSYESDVKPSLVEVYILYLRRKLAVAGQPDPIETVRGVGYRLRVPIAATAGDAAPPQG